MNNWIKNFDELATNNNRKIALEIIESGLDAINTGKVVSSSLSLVGDILSIKDEKFDLSKFNKIKIIGFGKSSPSASMALEKILKSKITEGVVIGLQKFPSKYIESFAGTHPEPSEANFLATKKIIEMVENSDENDLIIALITGGGSSLLCSSESELKQGVRLYEAFLGAGKIGIELNTIRKHISSLKGGGLAKLAYPATIIGLIFSDVPGDHFEYVASGPTYKDVTTVSDAKKIITENSLGEFDLIETPKEDKYFKKVHNFVLVSNQIAIEAMAKKAEEFKLETKIISTELYDGMDEALHKIFSAQKDNSVILAAGEPVVEVKDKSGKGGRNLHIGLKVAKNKLIGDNSLFVSFASDGMDNSDVAGAIVDKNTIEKIEKLGLDLDDYLNRCDSYPVFQKSGDMIMTGPTGSNVSDLMILLTKK